jgi:hypothetical protein
MPPPGFTFTSVISTGNTWSAKTSIPTGRYRVAAAEANGKIYAIGGSSASAIF